jgi:hypothetical protein
MQLIQWTAQSQNAHEPEEYAKHIEHIYKHGVQVAFEALI